MNKYLETNRDLWNGWTRIHQTSEMYDLEGFKAGNTSLKAVELEELGDVEGKSLLHLQCHFGMDTLSWARRGAQVTGVDLSDEAVELARSLSRELGIPAEFICSDIHALEKVLDGQFDIVFTSYGVLCWLLDLDRWAAIIARYLKPGGVFFMVEFHPLMTMLDDTGERWAYPYFHSPEPMEFETKGSYADPDAVFGHVSYEWAHGLGEVVTALIRAGLKLDYLHEFPYCNQKFLPFMEESSPGQYMVRDQPNTIPMMFSIRARC